MTTLNFTASNGKQYSLLALPNKLTSPSLKVGSSYVPCFTGSTESEVTSGEYIYTLSPMKVGSTRAAYKRRLSFGANGHVYIQLELCGVVFSNNDDLVLGQFTGRIERVYTNMAGYTVHTNITSTNEGSQTKIFMGDWTDYVGAYTYYWNGTYTVTHDASGSTVASGPFSIQAQAVSYFVGIINCNHPTFTIK